MKNANIHIRISDEKLKLLRILAKADRRTISATIDFAIEKYIETRKILKE
jgi:predicted transcriptional regulator